MRTMVPLFFAFFCLSAGAAQVDPSTAVTAVAGQNAVKDVIAQYTLNPLATVAATGKALQAGGQWSFRKIRPEACPKDASPCVAVMYAVPESQVTCEWAVMPEHDGVPARFLDENADAAKYLLRKVGAAELSALVVTSPQPKYPAIAHAAHVAGSVVVKVLVSESGMVSNAGVVSGPEMLRAETVDTAKRWTFRPFKVGSKAVPFLGDLTATFTSPGNMTNGSVKMQP